MLLLTQKKPINQKFSSTDAYETAPVMGLDHFENFLKCFEISPSIITVMPHFEYTKWSPLNLIGMWKKLFSNMFKKCFWTLRKNCFWRLRLFWTLRDLHQSKPLILGRAAAGRAQAPANRLHSYWGLEYLLFFALLNFWVSICFLS